MSSFLYLAGIMFLTSFSQADGATCRTTPTCQATDFTLATCTNKICNCINSSYVPIRSGCSLKLNKPIVTLSDPTKSNQVVISQSFTLTCTLAGVANYTWYLGSTLINVNTPTYTVAISSASDAGSYTCKGTTADGELTSDPSDAFKLEVLGTPGGLTTSSAQPVLYIPTSMAVSGSGILLECRNIPVGHSDTVKLMVDGAEVTNPVTLSNLNAGKDAFCSITNSTPLFSYSNGISATVKFPTIISNVQSVSVVVTNEDKRTEVEGLTASLECVLSPDKRFYSPTPTFSWMKNGTIIASSNSFLYATTEGTGVYTCSASYNNQTAVVSSNSVLFIENRDSVDPGAPSASSLLPIKGGRVILTCGELRTDGITYTWKKDSVLIPNQFDRKLQFDNVTDADVGTYSCDMTNTRMFTRTKTPVSLSVQTTISAPTLSTVGAYSRYGEGGDYYLSCSTDTETIGMTYKWTVRGQVSQSITGKYYSLLAVSSSDNGNYICNAQFNGVSSTASNTLTVTVTKPGKLCYEDNTCVGTGYTGECDTTDRCVCASGYARKGEECVATATATTTATTTTKSGVPYLTSSVYLTAAIYLIVAVF